MRTFVANGMMEFACLALIVTGMALSAEETPVASDLEKQQIESAYKLTRESAAKYEFFTRGDSTALELHSQPILRWSNPEAGQIYGHVFLWTRGGRPEVVGSLFKWFAPFKHMSHEFHSLSSGELSAKYDDETVWKTAQPGLQFAILPEAGDVAATPTARLSQMRKLAQQFTARSVDRKGMRLELRQLTQPAYRYPLPKEPSDLVDGAMFAFVQGTDPDVWLLLEADKSGGSAAQWLYAIARMNSINLSVEYRDKPIWHCDEISHREVLSHKLSYTSFRFDQP